MSTATGWYGAGVPNEKDLSAERSNQYGFCAAVLANAASSGALASDYGGGFILADGVDCTTETAG